MSAITLPEALGRTDARGRTIIGHAHRGCWSCGTVMRHESANGRVILHRPGSECCAPAITRLLGLAREELARHRKDAAAMRERVNEAANAAAENPNGRDAVALRAKAESVKRAYDNRFRDHWGPLVDGDDDEPGLKREIARLERKLAEMQR
jgi:hypothetical protein